MQCIFPGAAIIPGIHRNYDKLPNRYNQWDLCNVYGEGGGGGGIVTFDP